MILCWIPLPPEAVGTDSTPVLDEYEPTAPNPAVSAPSARRADLVAHASSLVDLGTGEISLGDLPCCSPGKEPERKPKRGPGEDTLFFQARKVPRTDDRAYQVLQHLLDGTSEEEQLGQGQEHARSANSSRPPSLEEERPTEVLREEFVHLRRDNSHHALQMRTVLQDMLNEVRSMQNMSRRMLEGMLKETTKSEYQVRLEIAGYGGQLLDALGSRHSHGQGFHASCETCQRGNTALIALVGMTDIRLIEPFNPSFF